MCYTTASKKTEFFFVLKTVVEILYVFLFSLPFLFFSLPSTPMAAPALSMTGKVRGARDVSRHKDTPCTKHFLAYAKCDQSRGNLKYSLNDAEFTWLLLTLFCFVFNSAATAGKTCNIHLSHKSLYIGRSRSF